MPEMEVRREPQNSSILVPRFQSGGELLNHTGGTVSHCGMFVYPRLPISELHLEKCPDSMEFQCWKVNFKTEVCSKLSDPHLTMHWIKEVTAKSTDDLVTSRLQGEQIHRPRYAWRDDCVCIEEASHACALLKNECRSEKREKYNRIFRGTQIADMIYEYFRATAAYEAVQGLSDWFAMSLQKDDVQDFDVRWDHALRFWIAAWYMESYWYFRKRFLNNYLLEKDNPKLSSKIQSMRHPLLADWDQHLQNIPWCQRWKWDENLRAYPYMYHASKVEVESLITLVELILTVVWWIMRDFQTRKRIWEFPRLFGISGLGGQFQDWSTCENSESSTHCAVDHRSREGKVNRRSYDIAIDC